MVRTAETVHFCENLIKQIIMGTPENGRPGWVRLGPRPHGGVLQSVQVQGGAFQTWLGDGDPPRGVNGMFRVGVPTPHGRKATKIESRMAPFSKNFIEQKLQSNHEKGGQWARDWTLL